MSKPALAALVAVLFLQPLAGANAQDSVESLKREVETLRARVETLERALINLGGEMSPSAAPAGMGDGATPATANAVPRRYAFLDGVRTVEAKADEASAAHVAKLEEELKQLNQTIEEMAQSVTDSAGKTVQPSQGSYTTDNNNGDGQSQSSRERAGREQQAALHAERQSKGVLLNKYRELARRKKAELKDLQDKTTGQRQVIHAHRGDMVIILETDRDLLASGEVDYNRDWSVLTWEGRLIEGSDESQRWLITSVKPVDAKLIPADTGTPETPAAAPAAAE